MSYNPHTYIHTCMHPLSISLELSMNDWLAIKFFRHRAARKNNLNAWPFSSESKCTIFSARSLRLAAILGHGCSGFNCRITRAVAIEATAPASLWLVFHMDQSPADTCWLGNFRLPSRASANPRRWDLLCLWLHWRSSLGGSGGGGGRGGVLPYRWGCLLRLTVIQFYC